MTSALMVCMDSLNHTAAGPNAAYRMPSISKCIAPFALLTLCLTLKQFSICGGNDGKCLKRSNRKPRNKPVGGNGLPGSASHRPQQRLRRLHKDRWVGIKPLQYTPYAHTFNKCTAGRHEALSTHVFISRARGLKLNCNAPRYRIGGFSRPQTVKERHFRIEAPCICKVVPRMTREILVCGRTTRGDAINHFDLSEVFCRSRLYWK